MSAKFVHLSVHSEFAVRDSIVRLPALMDKVKAGGMSAVALTDPHHFFGAVKFYRASQKAAVKPIFGTDIFIHREETPATPVKMTLLAKNAQGWANLTELISQSFQHGQVQGQPQVRSEWLTAERLQGVIALSGAAEGELGQAMIREDTAAQSAWLKHWTQMLPDHLYLEVQRLGKPHDDVIIRRSLELAQEYDLPIVATNPVCFIDESDFEAHEARVCIHDSFVLNDFRRPRRYTPAQHCRSEAEMCALFADLPEALENSVMIAERCNFQLTLGNVCLPNFPVPDGMTVEQFLEKESQAGLEKRLAVLYDPDAPEFSQQRKSYDERLKVELEVINNMGFPGYFLIVADFIRWAKQNDVPVGPGRGSGAGSLVAYALEITDLDPLEYDLLFERFLNPERVSMPDFDVDFCMSGRDRVIEYVNQKYGSDCVAQIITYGTMAAKAVVRDVGRVLGHPYGFVDKLAKLIPFELGITLDKALEQEEALKERYNKEEEVRSLIDLAKKLEGVTRNAGKHAGGVVIAPSKLTDFTALYCEENGGSIVTQYDKDDVEAIGLVKFDFLGLRTLTIIDWAVKIINAQGQSETPIDIARIPLDDKPSFDLLKACNTTAVFQLESRGMKDLIKRLQPDCFEDIVALVALFRPGPLQSGMVDDFINRKHGKEQVTYPHPDLEPILKPTYGVILYQEQVMQIAQVLAGYSLGDADLLRRAMGKKKPEEMAKQRQIFLDGAAKRDISTETATYIFDLMEKFAGYGFNKSHSAAYALVAYQTAWLKAHFPAAFMAAVLSSDMDNTDKVVGFIEDARKQDLAVLPPDINRGQYAFTVIDDKTICYGLGAVKGVGEGAIETIVAGREQGPYSSLFDLTARIDTKKLNRRTLEALVRAGAMDPFGENRATLCCSIEKALKASEQQRRNLSIGQGDLFASASATPTFEYVTMSPWRDQERLQGERDTLGLYLTGHPYDKYRRELSQVVSGPIAELEAKPGLQTVAGMVVAVRGITTKRGDRMAVLSLDDRTGRIEVAVFPKRYQEVRELLIKDSILVVQGEVTVDDYTGGVRMGAEDVWAVENYRLTGARGLQITLEAGEQETVDVPRLQGLLGVYQPGSCPVQILYQRPEGKGMIYLGEKWQVAPKDELLDNLRQQFGEDAIEMTY